MKIGIPLLLFCIAFIIQCTVAKINQSQVVYKVYKLDSLNAFYLIYGIKGGLRYKIVSSKQKTKNCSEIVIGGSYPFELHSMTEINGVSSVPKLSKFEISGLSVDEVTVIPFEHETQWELYFASNIRGLCFSKTSDK